MSYSVEFAEAARNDVKSLTFDDHSTESWPPPRHLSVERESTRMDFDLFAIAAINMYVYREGRRH